jgi:predicted ATPase
MELLKRLPDDTERARLELSVQTALGRCLANAKGWAAPELEAVYARALELCRQIHDRALAFRILYGQWGICHWKPELDKGSENR